MLKSQRLRKAGIMTGKNTIPAIVDNTINLPSYNMVRFVYFSVDSTDNPRSYKLKVRNRSIPVRITGELFSQAIKFRNDL